MIRTITLYTLLIVALQGCGESEAEREREQTVAPAKASVTVVDGAAVVSLEEVARQKAGIVTRSLQTVHHQRMIRALGTVLPIQEWVDLHNAYAAAKAQAETAEAAVMASRQEYLRVKGLHADDRNTSERTVQIAEAAFRSDGARAQASREALLSMDRNTRQQWGAPLAQAILTGSDLFMRVTSLEDALLQVSVPPGETLKAPPATVEFQTSHDTTIKANLIARLPRTDPRFQGTTLLYRVARSAFDAMAGTNLPVLLPSGEVMTGVNVPADAVVWWQGKAWVYVETSPGAFTRRELSADLPGDDGWFVAQGFAAGDAVVVRGAQLLLSQELLGQIQMGEGG